MVRHPVCAGRPHPVRSASPDHPASGAAVAPNRLDTIIDFGAAQRHAPRPTPARKSATATSSRSWPGTCPGDASRCRSPLSTRWSRSAPPIRRWPAATSRQDRLVNRGASHGPAAPCREGTIMTGASDATGRSSSVIADFCASQGHAGGLAPKALPAVQVARSRLRGDGRLSSAKRSPTSMRLNADACDQLTFPAYCPGRTFDFQRCGGADIGAG